MPTARDALYSFVQDRLVAETGQTISEFILVRREPGHEVPYRRIASEIVELTQIDITHEAARRWYHKAVKERDESEENRVTRTIEAAQAREAAVQAAA
jgi:hypothetical protein